MSKIKHAFQNGKALIGFLTGGDPSIEKSREFILEMVRGGVDLIEIGIPFSDPVAEGSVIQRANLRALSAGTTTDQIFDLVEFVRKESDVPLVFLTYLNPVLQYGYERFFERCNLLGVDGIIIPDLPFEEKAELADEAEKYGVDIISLIAPTSEERIRTIASEAKGFLYVVSSLGVTGVRSEIQTDLPKMIGLAKEAADIPTAVGFGISNPKQAKEIGKIADGVIVGSAIVKIIEEHGNEAAPFLYEYVKSMKDAIRG